jgi:hypothetical protein
MDIKSGYPAYLTATRFARFFTAATAITAAGGFFARKEACDDGRGAADAGFDGEGAGGAIFGAGAAFHARFAVFDGGFSGDDFKDPMGADFYAGSAAVAEGIVEFEGCSVADVVCIHGFLLRK